jgi:hypothetical protein
MVDTDQLSAMRDAEKSFMTNGKRCAAVPVVRIPKPPPQPLEIILEIIYFGALPHIIPHIEKMLGTLTL